MELRDVRGADGLTFGERLHLIRRRLRWGLERLAREVGVDPSTISRWEKDRHAPSATQLVGLAVVLDVSPNELLGYPDEGDSPQGGPPRGGSPQDGSGSGSPGSDSPTRAWSKPEPDAQAA